MATVLHNGHVFRSSFSPDPSTSSSTFVDCIIVEDGKITHSGSHDDAIVVAAIASGATTKDLNGCYILPSFIDSHAHLLMLSMSLQKVDLSASKSLEDIRNTIQAYCATNTTDERILCKGWMHSMTDGRAFASDIDGLDPLNRPIYIDPKDLHSTWCNTAAINELGVADMADPPGGCIHRDENGKPTGLLSETVTMLLVWPFTARFASMESKFAALKTGMETYSSAGYTGIIDMAMDENGWEALQYTREKLGGRLPIRIAAHWLCTPKPSEAENLAQVQRAIDLHSQYNAATSPDLRIAGIKIITDGVIDACTAALMEPYSNDTPTPNTMWTAAELGPVVRMADRAGLQCALHAIGDAAINLSINTLEQHGTPGNRHRIEHLELASPDDAVRLGKLGITASVQPVHTDPAILRAWPKLVGHRHAWSFAYKKFADHGACLALGTDAPTAPYAALPNLYIATTRRSAKEPECEERVNPEYALDLARAVDAGTAGSAYSCFSESFTGTLEVGKMADFVVVDMEWNKEKLLEAKILETWFQGEKVFDAKDVSKGEVEELAKGEVKGVGAVDAKLAVEVVVKAIADADVDVVD